MSAQEWRDMARDMLSTFGDEVLSVNLISYSTPVYDRAKGKNVATPITTGILAVPLERKSKLTNPDLWVAGDVMVLAGTYDLDFRIKPGMRLTWTDPISSEAMNCEIIQACDEDGGVSALAYLHVRRGGG